MRIVRFLCVALVFGGGLTLGSSAQADLVSFFTTGTFTGGTNTTPNTNTYTAPGILITFSSSLNNQVNVPPPSQVAFGQFNTTGTVLNPTGSLGGTFTLNIFQTGPTAGSVAFAGSLAGTLTGNSSTAAVTFSAPLSKDIGV